MACCPPEITQIFDSSAPATSNSYRFRVPAGQEGQLTATGLEPGDEIQVLTQDPNDPTVWVPMTIGGVPVVLTSTNPSVDLPPGLYRVVPSASVADNNPPVVVTGFTYRDVGLTSVAAYYGTPASYEEVEIVRVSEFGDPRLYRAGTDIEITPFDPALLFYELPPSAEITSVPAYYIEAGGDEDVIYQVEIVRSSATADPVIVYAGTDTPLPLVDLEYLYLDPPNQTLLAASDAYTVPNVELHVPVGLMESLYVQNLTGLPVQYRFGAGTPAETYELQDRGTLNISFHGDVYFLINSAFVQTAANRGLLISNFKQTYAVPPP